MQFERCLFKAPSDGEHSGGPFPTCRIPPFSIRRKWDAPFRPRQSATVSDFDQNRRREQRLILPHFPESNNSLAILPLCEARRMLQ